MEDYKTMWENFKEYLKSAVKFYHKGEMCSLSEAIVGEGVCKDLLKKMNRMDGTNEDTVCK